METFYKKRQEKEIQNAELKVKRIIETTDERQNKIINSHSSADNIPQIEKDEDVEMNGSDSELSYEERMKQKEAIRQEEEQALLKKKEEELEKKRKLEEKLKLLQKKPQNAVKKEEDVKQQKLAEFQQRKEQLLQNMNQEQNQDEDDEDLELQRVLELSRQEYMETMNLQQGDSSTNGSSEVVMERISLSTILTKVDGLKPRAVVCSSLHDEIYRPTNPSHRCRMYELTADLERSSLWTSRILLSSEIWSLSCPSTPCSSSSTPRTKRRSMWINEKDDW